jgi:site-specific DNA-methyltransferase (adenine-specific)
MIPYYQDSSVIIYNADCAEIIPGLSGIDHVITDPPYGEKETHNNHLSSIMLRDGTPARQALGFEGISSGAMVDLVTNWVELAARWVVFTGEWKYMSALDKAGLLVRMGIWRKPDGAPQFTGDRPGTGWEAVGICHRQGKKCWNGGGKHAFWEFAKGENRSGHPTGKPLGLFKAFVADFTDPGEMILDPYMGSGTTLVAAKNLGRRAIGIEKNIRFCEMAANRMIQEVMNLQ